MVHDPTPMSGNRAYRGIGFPTDNGGPGENYIYGNIIYNIGDMQNYGSSGITATKANIYNNTVYNIYTSSGSAIGIRNSSAGNIKNNVVINAESNCFVFGGSTTHDYNASSDLTATGDNSITGVTTAIFTSVTASSENFHLVAGASVIDEGVDLGSPYDVDAIGTTRPQGSAWDIGAFEYISATPATRNRYIFIN
jgi:hypothetical protein